MGEHRWTAQIVKQAWSSRAAAPPAGSVAAALARQLGPLLDITLVESDEIGTIGVGESTIPTARTFHHLLGIDEREFMRATQASFKLGIVVRELGARSATAISTRSAQIGKSTWMGDFQHFWLQAQRAGLRRRARRLLLRAAGGRGGQVRDRRERADQLCLSSRRQRLCASFLRGFSEPHGVRRVEGKIAEVEQHRRDRLHRGAGARNRASGSRATCSSTAPAFAGC